VPLLLHVSAGPALDVPHSVTPQQLEVLLNGLLQNEEKTPYSFYIEGQVGHSKPQQQQQQQQQQLQLHTMLKIRCASGSAWLSAAAGFNADRLVTHTVGG
jgi:hypothetical protein